MMTGSRCRLTRKDHALLLAMLERSGHASEAWRDLLQAKLRGGAVEPGDGISPGLVALDSRLTYFVNGVRTGPHLLVSLETGDLPPNAVSVHSLRGLALLGISEGDSVTIRPSAAGEETLTVETVLSQPRAAESADMPDNVRRLDFGGSSGSVISLRARRPAAPPSYDIDDDDDPGPSAA